MRFERTGGICRIGVCGVLVEGIDEGEEVQAGRRVSKRLLNNVRISTYPTKAAMTQFLPARLRRSDWTTPTDRSLTCRCCSFSPLTRVSTGSSAMSVAGDLICRKMGISWPVCLGVSQPLNFFLYHSVRSLPNHPRLTRRSKISTAQDHRVDMPSGRPWRSFLPTWRRTTLRWERAMRI